MTTVAELYSALKYRVDVHPVTGARRYFNHANQLHCEDGPALIFPNGTGVWYHNGVLHREGGPAVIGSNGRHFEWFQNGVLHRTDGPAVEYADGSREWWLDGVRHTEDAWRAATQPAVEMTVAEIEAALGKRIKVVK